MLFSQSKFCKDIIYEKKYEKEKRKSLKLSYRADYFYQIRTLPKHKRCYKKIAYLIRAHGKH